MIKRDIGRLKHRHLKKPTLGNLEIKDFECIAGQLYKKVDIPKARKIYGNIGCMQ